MWERRVESVVPRPTFSSTALISCSCIPHPGGALAFAIRTSNKPDWLLESDIARCFFAAIVAQAEVEELSSHKHYTVKRHTDRGLGGAE